MTIDKSFQEESKICYTDDMAKGVTTGTFNFEAIRQADILYVDKTKYIYKLVSKPENSRCFVSRPRRFGKSLCVNTLEKIFQGRKDLFEGLYIGQTDYDWKKYPVIKFSFGSCSSKNSKDLNGWIIRMLNGIASGYGFELNIENSLSEVFSELIKKLYAKHGKVVILVDEYEKVITDNIYNENIEEMRDVLSSFYQVLKDMDEYIHFVFITGVTKYTKLSLFSKMNNLMDISMEYEYAEMFGYTQEELEHYFAEHIDEKLATGAMDKKSFLEKLKVYYDGYRFNPYAQSVYNPVSIGQYFQTIEMTFKNYWIDTGGMMTMFFDVAERCDFDIAEDLMSPVLAESFSRFDILAINKKKVSKSFLKCFMFQAGYLTIKDFNPDINAYYFDFPNKEVRKSFTDGLLCSYFQDEDLYTIDRVSFADAILKGDTDRLFVAIKAMFAGIPSLVYSKAEKTNEYYYQSLVYMMFSAIGMTVNLEEITSGGRIDAVAENKDTVFIIEFKLNKSARDALSQIRTNHYADKFLSKGKKIKLIGINFSSKDRNIDDYLVEEL